MLAQGRFPIADGDGAGMAPPLSHLLLMAPPVQLPLEPVGLRDWFWKAWQSEALPYAGASKAMIACAVWL